MSLLLFLNLSNSYLSMNMTRINYAVCLCISLHGLESICGFSRSFFSKNESLSRLGTLQAITYVGLHGKSG